MLTVEGFHVPVILFVEVVGSDGADDPWHNGPTCVKVVVTTPLTVISMVVGVAHPEDVGVNVYTVVPVADVFIVEGLHVPVILLLDVAGSDGGADPWHNGPISVKVGVTWLLIVMVMV